MQISYEVFRKICLQFINSNNYSNHPKVAIKSLSILNQTINKFITVQSSSSSLRSVSNNGSLLKALSPSKNESSKHFSSKALSHTDKNTLPFMSPCRIDPFPNGKVVPSPIVSCCLKAYLWAPPAVRRLMVVLCKEQAFFSRFCTATSLCRSVLSYFANWNNRFLLLNQASDQKFNNAFEQSQTEWDHLFM